MITENCKHRTEQFVCYVTLFIIRVWFLMVSLFNFRNVSDITIDEITCLCKIYITVTSLCVCKFLYYCNFLIWNFTNFFKLQWRSEFNDSAQSPRINFVYIIVTLTKRVNFLWPIVEHDLYKYWFFLIIRIIIIILGYDEISLYLGIFFAPRIRKWQ
jgi:hypothetical protein